MTVEASPIGRASSVKTAPDAAVSSSGEVGPSSAMQSTEEHPSAEAARRRLPHREATDRLFRPLGIEGGRCNPPGDRAESRLLRGF